MKARQSLLRLRESRGLPPELKPSVNMLLALCYRSLGDSEMADDANHRALIADPQNLEAKLASIATLVNQGEIVMAIKEYQALVDRAPQARLNLAGLLIARNRQQPQSERDWGEVKHVIDDAAKAAPESVDPIILEAESLRAQDKADEARKALEKARSRFPKSVRLREVQANLLGSLGQFDAARKLLDEAREELGDQVELRLARAHFEGTQTGPEVVNALNNLAQHAEAYSKEDRRRLLEGLAIELVRQQDLEGAMRLLATGGRESQRPQVAAFLARLGVSGQQPVGSREEHRTNRKNRRERRSAGSLFATEIYDLASSSGQR